MSAPTAEDGEWVPVYEDNMLVRLRWQHRHARNTDPDTSTQAAQPTHRTNTIWANLEHAYRTNPRGLTASEAARFAGYTEADGAWKRVSDLLADGLIESTGQTRPGPHGRMQRVLRWVPTEVEQEELW